MPFHVEPVLAEGGASPIRAEFRDERAGGRPLLAPVGSRDPEFRRHPVTIDDRGSHAHARLPLIVGLLADVVRQRRSPHDRRLRRVSDVDHIVAEEIDEGVEVPALPRPPVRLDPRHGIRSTRGRLIRHPRHYRARAVGGGYSGFGAGTSPAFSLWAPSRPQPSRSATLSSPRSTTIESVSVSVSPLGALQRRLQPSWVPGSGTVGGAKDSDARQSLDSSVIANQF